MRYSRPRTGLWGLDGPKYPVGSRGLLGPSAKSAQPVPNGESVVESVVNT